MSYLPHVIAKPARDAVITIGRAATPGDFSLNFGETATIVLTPNQIVETLAQLQAAIDEHMRLRPVAAA
jgi:hypothetical protein